VLPCRTRTVRASWVSSGITAGRLQLRLGRDLRWYPYARSDTEWDPAGRPRLIRPRRWQISDAARSAGRNGGMPNGGMPNQTVRVVAA
jgi:hypothetical protein